MSHRSRQEAARRARELGAQARREGRPQTANPYKPGGAWSLHPHWWAGWTLADNKPANAPISPPNVTK